MKKFGPYKIGDTIPDDAPVGVSIGLDWFPNHLYVAVGEFEENITSVPSGTPRQYIDYKGKVVSNVSSGPATKAKVKMWCMIDEYVFCSYLLRWLQFIYIR